MTYYHADPILDFHRYSSDMAEREKHLPNCPICEDKIHGKGVVVKDGMICDEHIIPVDDDLPATCSYCGAERDMKTEYLQHEDFVWVGKTGICLCLNCLEEGRKEYEYDQMAV